MKIKKLLSVNGRVDMPLLISVILLSAFGTVMVFSAGGAYAAARYDDSAYFVKKHIVWLCLGFLIMFFASKIPVRLYKKWTPALYVLTLILLVLVLIVGFVGNGAKRWISIGPITVQPSEIAQITIIMMLALYFSKYGSRATEEKQRLTVFKYGTLFPILIFAIPIILVMLQRHLSCIIILGIL